MHLAWDAVEDADGYRVYYLEETVDVTTTAHRLRFVTFGGSYEIQVASLQGTAVSDRSGVLRVTLPDAQPPTEMTGSATGNEVTLGWNEGTGSGSWSGPGGSGSQEVRYRLQRRTPPGSGPWVRLESRLADRTYVDSGLAYATAYEYAVWDGAGGGPGGGFGAGTAGDSFHAADGSGTDEHGGDVGVGFRLPGSR